MGQDVEPLVCQLLHLVLTLGDHHCHIGRLQHSDLVLERLLLLLGGRGQVSLKSPQVVLPVGLNLVVHLHGGGLVDADHHRLALVAPADEVLHQILGDGFQAVITGDQVVLTGEDPLDLLLLILVQLGIFQKPGQILVEVLVDQLQLGDTVLVVERHRGPISDGLPEVVDRDVVTKHLLGLFLTGHQRRPGEAQEGGMGQRRPHVHGQGVVLGAVGLVGDDDDVLAVGDLGVGLALLGAELLDQREDVAVILAEQLLEVGTALCVGLHLVDCPRGSEGLVDLLVQLVAVGDDHERPVAGDGAVDLLGEEHHGERLPRSLGMPEDPQPTRLTGRAILDPQQLGDGLVHPEVLVVLGDLLDGAALGLLEHREVLHDVQQPCPLGDASDGRLQGHHPLLALVIDTLPLEEVLPG